MNSKLIKPLFILCSRLTGAKQFSIFLNALKSFDNNIYISLLTIKDFSEIPSVHKTYYADENSKFINKILRFLLFSDLGKLPDKMRFTHNPFLLYKARNLFKKERFTYIHTNSFPCSTHLIGLYLKKEYSIPWIAHFYDPWVNNPYRLFKFNYFKNIDSNIERKIAENADLIIHTNQNIKNDWINRYGSDIGNKIFVMPFVYNDEIITEANKRIKSLGRKSDKLIISHIGNLHKQRNIAPLVKALLDFNKEFPELEKEILFRFIGKTAKENTQIIIQNNLFHQFEFVDSLPTDKLQNFYDESDILLVIDAPSDDNLFFPSKLMDYFLQKKPILGLTSNNGSTFTYLHKAGHTSISHDNIRAIKLFLYNAICDYESLLHFDEHFYNNFTGKHIEDYCKIVSKIISRN